MKNRIRKRTLFSEEKEKIKQETQFNNNIIAQTFFGLYLEKINPAKTLAKERPK